jgi:hypothetical protein
MVSGGLTITASYRQLLSLPSLNQTLTIRYLFGSAQLLGKPTEIGVR